MQPDDIAKVPESGPGSPTHRTVEDTDPDTARNLLEVGMIHISDYDPEPYENDKKTKSFRKIRSVDKNPDEFSERTAQPIVPANIK